MKNITYEDGVNPDTLYFMLTFFPVNCRAIKHPTNNTSVSVLQIKYDSCCKAVTARNIFISASSWLESNAGSGCNWANIVISHAFSSQQTIRI